ncbi:MAG: hypothetical protein E7478_01330 [Ruminococcaceae bacterium]|nr:hypothetical protein [Oscillospiraceae bacterium]
MAKHYNDAELYLDTYPKLRKWINECVVCHSKGYKPDMPEHIGGEYSVSGAVIRQYFRPLELNDDNICLQCSRHIS